MRIFKWIFFALFFNSCQRKEIKITPAFYYWKTVFTTTSHEKEIWNRIGFKKMGLRFFDVGMENGIPRPMAELKIESALPDKLNIEPVVFIQEKVFRSLDSVEAWKLGEKIFHRISGMAAAFHISFNQIQLDCDWTLSSRNLYFTLIKAVKNKALKTRKAPVNITCTLRLHQFKYPDKAGIPPADRVVLMIYNLNNPGSRAGQNSIFFKPLAEKYISKRNVNYPIPMDAAIPLFSWGVLKRQHKNIRLLNHWSPETSPGKIQMKSKHTFQVISPFEWQGFEVMEGDQISYEAAGIQEAKEAASLFSHAMNNSGCSMFIFDHQNIPQNDSRKIQNLFTLVKPPGI